VAIEWQSPDAQGTHRKPEVTGQRLRARADERGQNSATIAADIAADLEQFATIAEDLRGAQ